MNVKRDLSDLPPVEKPAGVPPISEPQFVSAIADSWFNTYLAEGQHMRSKANEALPYRASNTALRCDRQLFYAMAGVERPIPNIADAYRMSLGTLVHSGLEDAIKTAFPNAEFEVQVDLTSIGVAGSAHADIVTYLDQTQRKVDAVVEVKTVNGFGFKSMATDFKGPAQGPRSGHVLQAALSALALDADRVVVAYLSMENLSPGMSKYVQSDIGRFAAEWHYSRDEYETLARKEIARIQRVIEWLGIPDLIPPTTVHDDNIPDGAYISTPGLWIKAEDGQITDTGKVWYCDYCDFKDRCVADTEKYKSATPII